MWRNKVVHGSSQGGPNGPDGPARGGGGVMGSERGPKK